MSRELHWDGGRNLRDLGGPPTPLADTGTTAFGRVARGARRELLTQRGWDEAAQWGLESVVDLRTAEEVGARGGDPNAEPPAAIAITLAPNEDHSKEEFQRVCFPILDSPEYWAANISILPDYVRTALESVAAAEPGVLVHCAAGRDRTGLISTLLLANACVTPRRHL